MDIDFYINGLILNGAKIVTIGNTISVVAAINDINTDESDGNEVAKLTVISNLLSLVSNTIALIAILILNQQNDENQDGAENQQNADNQDGAENQQNAEPLNSQKDKIQELATESAWLTMVSSALTLKGSLLELQELLKEKNE